MSARTPTQSGKRKDALPRPRIFLSKQKAAEKVETAIVEAKKKRTSGDREGKKDEEKGSGKEKVNGEKKPS